MTGRQKSPNHLVTFVFKHCSNMRLTEACEATVKQLDEMYNSNDIQKKLQYVLLVDKIESINTIEAMAVRLKRHWPDTYESILQGVYLHAVNDISHLEHLGVKHILQRECKITDMQMLFRSTNLSRYLLLSSGLAPGGTAEAFSMLPLFVSITEFGIVHEGKATAPVTKFKVNSVYLDTINGWGRVHNGSRLQQNVKEADPYASTAECSPIEGTAGGASLTFEPDFISMSLNDDPKNAPMT
jgi:hypothetical protein